MNHAKIPFRSFKGLSWFPRVYALMAKLTHSGPTGYGFWPLFPVYLSKDIFQPLCRLWDIHREVLPYEIEHCHHPQGNRGTSVWHYPRSHFLYHSWDPSKSLSLAPLSSADHLSHVHLCLHLRQLVLVQWCLRWGFGSPKTAPGSGLQAVREWGWVALLWSQMSPDLRQIFFPFLLQKGLPGATPGSAWTVGVPLV